MPDQGDAEILWILGGQARQHGCFDFVPAERRLVLLNPELPQQSATSVADTRQ